MRTREDPHVIALKKEANNILNDMGRQIRASTRFTEEQKKLWAEYTPSLREDIKAPDPRWPHLSFLIRRIRYYGMKLPQIEANVPTARAFTPREIAKMPKMLVEARKAYLPDADKTLRRLPPEHRNRICKLADCAKPFHRLKDGNVIKDDGVPRTDEDLCQHPPAIKARNDERRKKREMQKESDKRAARRKDKESRGKPNPEYDKAMEKRKKELREKERAEGAPSREERRKSRGF